MPNRIICLNDPVNFVDPLGLKNWAKIGSGAAKTAGGVISIGIGAGLISIGVEEISHLNPMGIHAIGEGLKFWMGGVAMTAWGVNDIMEGWKTDEAEGDDKPVCFAAGTEIFTPEGFKKIEEIKSGDLVLSRNEETGEITPQKVTKTFVTPDKYIRKLSFNGDSDVLYVTNEHPFMVKDKGWIEAKSLSAGENVLTYSGEWISVSSNTETSKKQTVYNFEVENFHTYFVGKGKICVHNSCGKTKF